MHVRATPKVLGEWRPLLSPSVLRVRASRRGNKSSICAEEGVTNLVHVRATPSSPKGTCCAYAHPFGERFVRNRVIKSVAFPKRGRTYSPSTFGVARTCTGAQPHKSKALLWLQIVCFAKDLYEICEKRLRTNFLTKRLQI